MTGLFWFVFGAFVGVDLALTYAWLTTRRANQSVTRRVALYTDRTLHFDTPSARKALRDLRKPW